MEARAAGADAAAPADAAAGGRKLLRDVLIVTHCVERLETSEGPWTSLLGYRTVERGTLSPELCAAWDTPAALGQRYALLQPASGEAVYLRFIETGERGHDPPATWGWSATELLAEDVDALARRLDGSPFRRLGGPGDLYARPNAPRALQAIGPSGELVYFTRLLPGGSRYGLKQARSFVDRPFIVTVGAPACAQPGAFYGGVLGQRIMDRTPFINGILALLCQVPADTVFPTSIVRIPGRRFLLEIDEYPESVRPRPRRSGHLPRGMAMVSFAVRSLGALATLSPGGLPVRAPPRALHGIGYGGRRAAVIEGPAGEWLELIEETACASTD